MVNSAPVVGALLFARNPLHLESLQQIVGGLIEPVSQGLDGVHHCYVNEKGLLGDRQYFFLFKNGHQPLASNGVILSLTQDGDEAPLITI